VGTSRLTPAVGVVGTQPAHCQKLIMLRSAKPLSDKAERKKNVPAKSVLNAAVSGAVLQHRLFPLTSNANAYVLTLLSSNINGVTTQVR
jgi:hypothetical protein